MIIKIIAKCGMGKSIVARQIADLLKRAGAKVVIKDEIIDEKIEQKLAQNFSTIIKSLRSKGQKIVIQTVQANRDAKIFDKKRKYVKKSKSD